MGTGPDLPASIGGSPMEAGGSCGSLQDPRTLMVKLSQTTLAPPNSLQAPDQAINREEAAPPISKCISDGCSSSIGGHLE